MRFPPSRLSPSRLSPSRLSLSAPAAEADGRAAAAPCGERAAARARLRRRRRRGRRRALLRPARECAVGNAPRRQRRGRRRREERGDAPHRHAWDRASFDGQVQGVPHGRGQLGTRLSAPRGLLAEPQGGGASKNRQPQIEIRFPTCGRKTNLLIPRFSCTSRGFFPSLILPSLGCRAGPLAVRKLCEWGAHRERELRRHQVTRDACVYPFPPRAHAPVDPLLQPSTSPPMITPHPLLSPYSLPTPVSLPPTPPPEPPPSPYL